MPTARPMAYSAISSSSRVEILHLIQQRAHRSIAELVAATGLHPNTVREHLQRMIDDGYIVVAPEHRRTRGRPRMLYSMADPADGSSDILRRRIAASAARGDLMRRVLPDSRPRSLGTEALHQLDAVIDDLEDAGFAPVLDERALTIDLSPCAHAPVCDEERSLRCQVHLGIIEGILAAAGGPLSIDDARSSCARGECLIHLRHTQAAALTAP
ncbi:winged helix-turn-helix transcriptional regulator [Microbacterium sp.]|uniref:winged helix-turn-helix transcriptional regulator n=1 Tax=Microbacterium sp. TaxID=51671 RepID=UPI003A8BBE0C